MCVCVCPNVCVCVYECGRLCSAVAGEMKQDPGPAQLQADCGPPADSRNNMQWM